MADDDEEHTDAETFCVYSAIFIIYSVVSLFISGRIRCTYLSDAGLLLLSGFLGGGLIKAAIRADGTITVQERDVEHRLLWFSSETLFCVLLPPIIFKSGYDMQGKHFWANIDKIIFLAFGGTLASSFIVGGCFFVARAAVGLPELSLPEALSFGALISATDPVTTLAIFEQLHVDPDLFNVVFGESVLNDAVSIVLFHTFIKFIGKSGPVTLRDVGVAAGEFAWIFGGSLVLGVLLAFLAARLFKFTRHYAHLLHHGQQLELTLFLITCYTPFLLAEALSLSGIVAILFTGVVTRRKIVEHLSSETLDRAESVVGMLAYAAESLIFIELGTNAWRPFHASWKLVAWITGACLVARAAHVYPIGIMLNLTQCCKSSKPRFTCSHMNMVWFSGLRGAIAYALSTKFPGKYEDNIASLTMAIVLLTIFVFGGATSPMLKCQGITLSETHTKFEDCLGDGVDAVEGEDSPAAKELEMEPLPVTVGSATTAPLDDVDGLDP